MLIRNEQVMQGEWYVEQAKDFRLLLAPGRFAEKIFNVIGVME